jgi:LDH2 family malate/lactate/ureidoglycolate dehydrogenase
MPVISEAGLRDLCQRILVAAGAPADTAQAVAKILVNADIKGVDSHGCRLLLKYVDDQTRGVIVPAAQPEITRHDGAISQIEGHWCYGQVAALLCVRQVVESARQFGVGAATIVHVSHIGRVGEYVEQIAQENMLGIAMCNAGRAVTPHGGMKRMFGTNPIAMAVPRKDGRVLRCDFATSAKSVNKLSIYRQREEPLPEGVILDKHGNATTDANDFFDGGVLLPAGAYKGYALNLFVDIIGGILTGAGCAATLNTHPGNGVLFIALDITRWRSMNEFVAELEDLLAAIKRAPRAPDFEEILLPGELEDRAEEQRRRKGIPLDDETWADLKESAARVGLPESIFD